MTVSPITVLMFSRDPGPTNQLVALHQALTSGVASPAADALREWMGTVRGGDIHIHVHAKRYANEVWARTGIVAAAWDVDVDDNVARLDALLEQVRPDFVITGVEDVDEHDHHLLWELAQARSIPVAAVFDCHRSAELRLVQKGEDGHAMVLKPNLLLVPDESVKATLQGQGIEAHRIRVVGNPHLESLSGAGVDDSKRAELRHAWGASNEDFVILFVSENQTEMGRAGRKPPYDELAILGGFVDGLRRGKAPGIDGKILRGRTLHLVIRPHPRDDVGKYEAFCGTKDLSVVVSDTGAPDVAVCAADLIVGMDSMLLREAQVLGCKVISLVYAPDMRRVL